MAEALQSTGGDAKPTWYFRIRPWLAYREMKYVRDHPEDLVAIARVFFYFGGHDDGSIHRRILRDPDARRVLEERRPLPEVLCDLEALKRYPEGSLARCYAADLERHGLDPAQIDADTRLAHAHFEATPEHDFIRIRMRSLHDLIHTLTGYGVDGKGEGGIVAFTYANAGNRGYRSMALFNCANFLFAGQLGAVRFVWDGFRRGRKARFLWGQDWEALLSQPLDAVREKLGIEAVGPYEPQEFPHRQNADAAAAAKA